MRAIALFERDVECYSVLTNNDMTVMQVSGTTIKKANKIEHYLHNNSKNS